jgi:hypothetical protein
MADMNKLDVGAFLLILPYIFTLIWIIYGSYNGYQLLSKEMLFHIGKDPILFVISSLSFNMGFIFILIGYIETKKTDKVFPLSMLFTAIVLINLFLSIVLASMIGGGLSAGLSLLSQSQFILMYNLIILLIAFILPIRFQKRVHIDKNLSSGLSMITLLVIYGILRILTGPSIYLLVLGLVGVLSILYVFHFRSS